MAHGGAQAGVVPVERPVAARADGQDGGLSAFGRSGEGGGRAVEVPEAVASGRHQHGISARGEERQAVAVGEVGHVALVRQPDARDHGAVLQQREALF